MSSIMFDCVFSTELNWMTIMMDQCVYLCHINDIFTGMADDFG